MAVCLTRPVTGLDSAAALTASLENGMIVSDLLLTSGTTTQANKNSVFLCGRPTKTCLGFHAIHASTKLHIPTYNSFLCFHMFKKIFFITSLIEETFSL